MLLDCAGQPGDIRWTGFIKAFGPGRVAVQQTGGKIAAIADVLKAVFSRYGDGRKDIPTGFFPQPGHLFIIEDFSLQIIEALGDFRQ